MASKDLHKDLLASCAAGPAAAADASCRRASATMCQPDSLPRHPLDVAELDQAVPPRCVAHMDLTREECGRLFPSSRERSQMFCLAGRLFSLTARCDVDMHGGFPCFGLFLGAEEEEDEEAAAAVMVVGYEFAARTRPSGEFVGMREGSYAFTGGREIGYQNLLGVPWAALVADDSVFFVDGVLRLRAVLTVEQP